MKRITVIALIVFVGLSSGVPTESAEKESDFYKRKPIQNINTDHVEQWVSIEGKLSFDSKKREKC